MGTPRQMTAHTLDAPKGWPSPHAVDFRAKLSTNVTIDPFFAGRCVHLNGAGEYESGVPAGGAGIGHMALFVFQNSDDPDVANPGGITGLESDDPGGWMAVAPTGQIMGLVAEGAYELETTEFEPETSLGEVYAPGDLLQGINANADAVTGGRITKGIQYVVPIVGVVSRGVVAHGISGKDVLAFWPVWLPELPDGICEPSWLASSASECTE